MEDTTRVDWAIHPDADNPSSDWYVHQYGTWTNFAAACPSQPPGPPGAGFISGDNFRHGIYRHEIGNSLTRGTLNSHYDVYLQQQSRPENNLRKLMEGEVGAVATRIGDFHGAVENKLRAKLAALDAESKAIEPCSQHCTDDCRNYNGPANKRPYR